MFESKSHPAKPLCERRISVISVTFNNAAGLFDTLSSLAALREKPFEVIVVDGDSKDSTREVLSKFLNILPLVILVEPDDGIYDAMNKGLHLARGSFIHYLNAGDTVFGEPYADIIEPCLLPVRIFNENGDFVFNDFVKFGGYGYCHQGVIFPAQHPEYRTQFKVSADLDLIMTVFPRGLATLRVCSSGGIAYCLGGISTTAVKVRNREGRRVIMDHMSMSMSVYLMGIVFIKNLIPRSLRRVMVHMLMRNCKHGRREY